MYVGRKTIFPGRMSMFTNFAKRIINILMLMVILVYPMSSLDIARAAPSHEQQHEKALKSPSNQALPTNQIIIKYKADSSASTSPNETGLMQRLKHVAGIDLAYLRPMSGDANVLHLPKRLPLEQVQAISRKLMALPEVEYAEPDEIASPMLTPNDPRYSEQWDLFGT